MSLQLKRGSTRTRVTRSIEDKARVIIAVEGGMSPKDAFVDVFGVNGINKSMDKHPASILDSFRRSINSVLAKGGDAADALRNQLADGGVELEDTESSEGS